MGFAVWGMAVSIIAHFLKVDEDHFRRNLERSNIAFAHPIVDYCPVSTQLPRCFGNTRPSLKRVFRVLMTRLQLLTNFAIG